MNPFLARGKFSKVPHLEVYHPELVEGSVWPAFPLVPREILFRANLVARQCHARVRCPGGPAQAGPQEATPRPLSIYGNVSLPATSCSVPLGGTEPGQQVARATRLSLALFALFLLIISPSPADVTGTITLQGKPNSKDETFVASSPGCGESPVRTTENWKIGPKGELADVVVWIVNPILGPLAGQIAPPPEIELKQFGCRYIPHVTAVQAGVPFKITNADPTLHNIHAKTSDGANKPPGQDVPGFNFGQARQGQTDERQFDEPGLYTLQCDVHPWMQCWVKVLPQTNLAAYAVTGPDGTFNLAQSKYLADGDYKIDAWHPRFAQPLEQTIHVKNGTANVNFQFDGAKSF